MSFNGSGTFNINSTGQPVVTATVISSTVFNAFTADIGTGLTNAICKDGQSACTARIPFANGINSTLATDATSTGTGSILTAGGVGIAKALWVGGLVNIASTLTVQGALTAQGTLAVTGAVTLTALDTTGVLRAGVYTPTLTNGTNVAASTNAECQYLRVGNTVTVSGMFQVDPTLGGGAASEMGLSLPIASNFGAPEDCAGVGSANTVFESLAIQADATNDRASVNWASQTTANHTILFTFTYQVI